MERRQPLNKPINNLSKLLSFNSLQIEINCITAAMRIGLFDLLQMNFFPVDDIMSKLKIKCNRRNFIDFLDKLYVSVHLEREGILKDAKYKTAHNDFVSNNPSNLIPVINYLNEIWTEKQNNLYTSLINDKECKQFKNNIYVNEECIKNFLQTMSIVHQNNFEQISTQINFSHYTSLFDIGGCLGTFCLKMKEKNDHMECFNFDLPDIEPYAREFYKTAYETNKIKYYAADFFIDEIPKCDVISMGNILHMLDWEQKIFVLKKAYDALKENGILLIMEDFIDDDRKYQTSGLNLSVLMLIQLNQGFNISMSDLNIISTQIGFKSIENLKGKINVDVAICYK
jgi:hypothetical protein